MRIKSKPYGEVDVDESNVITIQEGLFGFEGLERYVFIEPETGGPVLWLQSLDDPGLAFVVIRPEEFKKGYKLEVPQEDLEAIGLESPDQAVSLAIVVVPDNPAEMSANLQGPLVLNIETRVARQMISLNPHYSTRHIVLEEMQELLQSPPEPGQDKKQC